MLVMNKYTNGCNLAGPMKMWMEREKKITQTWGGEREREQGEIRDEDAFLMDCG